MIESMRREMIFWRSNGWDGPCRSVYFGGGTPSILEMEEIQTLLDEIQEQFGLASDAEVTLEANPDDINSENLESWWNAGVNRLSLGVQSFDENDLKWMNRSHDSHQALRSLELIKESSFSNYSLDLIYGLPTNSIWAKNLETALEFSPQHISAYTLTVEPKTVLAHKVNKGTQSLLEEEEVEKQYAVLCETLKAHGYEHYEISNFAKVGQKADHNSSYWEGEAYLGIGPSAHSFQGNKRWWNVPNNATYRRQIETSEPWYEEELLTAESRWNELLMTGLRRSKGVSFEVLKQHLPSGANLPEKEFFDLKKEGVIQEVDGHWRIPEIHWLVSDHIIMKLML